MKALITILILLSLSSAKYFPWANNSAIIEPRRDAFRAIAYDEVKNSFYVVGGNSYKSNFFEYPLNASNTVTQIIDYGTNYLWVGPFHAQAYSQQNNILYIMPFSSPGNRIYKMDIFAQTVNSYTTTSRFTHSACVTTFTLAHEYLVVTGGHSATNLALTWGESTTYTQILDMTDNSWITNSEPRMNQPRMYHACNVVDQRIYAIGGYNHPCPACIGGSRTDIDILDISEGIEQLSSASWRIMSETMPDKPKKPRTAVYGFDILVLSNKGFFIIDTLTETVSFPGSLGLSENPDPFIFVHPYFHYFTDEYLYHQLKFR